MVGGLGFWGVEVVSWVFRPAKVSNCVAARRAMAGWGESVRLRRRWMAWWAWS